MLVELDDRPAVVAHAQVPNAVCKHGDVDIGSGGGRVRGRPGIRERRKLSLRHVDAIRVDLEHERDLIPPVEPAHQAERQLHAGVGHVAGEVRGDGDIAEVGVRNDSARPGRQVGGGVESHPDRRAVLDDELHDGPPILHADRAEPRFRIERFEHSRQRMVQHVCSRLQRRTPIPAVPERRGEREHIALRLLVHGPPVGKVERPLSIGQGTPFRRRVHVARQVPATVLIDSLAETREHDVVETPEALQAAHRVRGRVEQATRDVFLRPSDSSQAAESRRDACCAQDAADDTHFFPLAHHGLSCSLCRAAADTPTRSRICRLPPGAPSPAPSTFAKYVTTGGRTCRGPRTRSFLQVRLVSPCPPPDISPGRTPQKRADRYGDHRSRPA